MKLKKNKKLNLTLLHNQVRVVSQKKKSKWLNCVSNANMH